MTPSLAPEPLVAGESGRPADAAHSTAAHPAQSLRILLFTAVDRDLRGGVATVYRRLSTALQDRGHSISEIWGAQPGHAPADDELPLTEIHTRLGLPTPASAAASARFVSRLAALLRRHRPQIVNMHFVHARMAQVLLWLRPVFGYKLVLSAHGSDLFDPPEGNPQWLPRVLPRADAVVAVTEVLAGRIRAFPGVRPARVAVIPGGIDAEFWAPGNTAGPLASRRPLVVAVGQLRHIKGHDILLDAWPHVLAHTPRAELIIIGDGDRRRELRKQAHQRGVGGSVTFAGQQPPEEVRRLLGQARLFVLPSRSEALPLALLEAMALGVPAVATEVGGVPDLLGPGPTGLVVPPQDPAALAAAITALLHDSTRADQFAARARDRAMDYSAAATAAAYEQLFIQMVTRRAGSGDGR